ncbi:hypothetical protein [Streptomyces cinereoruber]|uniref:hypothetical protein n=1 Tax=Streptomyces cinereoruber TaxID=67260 RepID=UPI003C2E3717
MSHEARERIENLWDRATPVAPLLDAYRAEVLREAAEDPALIEAARRHVEDFLIESRDDRVSILGRGNGFCIAERDGTPSSFIRLGTAEGIRMALRRMADEVGP